MTAGTQSDAGSTKDTPNLSLTGELWGVFCKYFWENWPYYNGTALYFDLKKMHGKQTASDFNIYARKILYALH